MLPVEKFDEQWRSNLQQMELKWCKRFFLLLPLLVLALIPVISRYLLWVLYLQPPLEILQWDDFFQAKAMILSLGIVVIPVFWWCGLKWERKKQTKVGSVALMILFIAGSNVLLTTGSARWFFVEWAKVRTPNPSFARNTLFWEQRNFEQSPQCSSVQSEIPLRQKQVQLVGSSQIYQATNLHILEAEAEEFCVEKNCLAGFGPIQYQFLMPRIAERNPDIIVCWLSEFDFYREDNIPTNRLRWGASSGPLITLIQQLDRVMMWTSRGDLADLSLAAYFPLWRNRDHIKRTFLHYWWDRSRPINQQIEQVDVLAQSVGLEQALGFLKKSIHRSQMLEVNFRCFEQFALACQEANIELIVFEGQSHPLAVQAYDVNYKTETRKRLSDLSQSCDFRFYDYHEIPHFTDEEFGDAYHLNSHGQKRWTKFLGQTLNHNK